MTFNFFQPIVNSHIHVRRVLQDLNLAKFDELFKFYNHAYYPKTTKISPFCTKIYQTQRINELSNFAIRPTILKLHKFAALTPKFTNLDELTEHSEQVNLTSFPNFAIRPSILIKISKNLLQVEALCLNVDITNHDGLVIYVILHYFNLFMCLRVEKIIKR